MMQRRLKSVLLPVLCSAALLAGCSGGNAPEDAAQAPDAEDKIMQELASEPVKAFPKTAQDVQDIQALLDFDQRFTAVSDDMEDELMRMKDAGSLTPEFAAERKRDNVDSALRMLKELDLKTEQGRYIQGLIYQYWNQQAQLLQASPGQEHSGIDGLGKFIHAQEQLAHWQAQYPELKTAP